MAVFRPLTTRLGELLEQVRRDRQQQAEQVESARMAQLMETLLERLETRQDFTERVIESAGWKGDAGPSLAAWAEGERRSRTGGS